MNTAQPKHVWNGLNLDELRLVMDKPSDEAVQAIYESHSMHHLRTLLKGMAENDSVIPHELPDPMKNLLLDERHYVYSEKDIAAFKRSHVIWKKHGMDFVFSLFFRGLPFTYMAEKPANVLRMTRLLEDHPERRIFETAQFVFDVMDEDWWTPEKRGVLTALKIRIMHSAMRHVILDQKDEDEWNSEWGMPISQEDLIATNQVFSLEFFNGMEKLGEPLDAEDQAAWFHSWKVIAKIMGVQDELLCPTVAEAWTLQKSIYNHLFANSGPSGVGLSKALVETLAHFMMSTKLILLIMKKMLHDPDYPDCFEIMLKPSFESHYPEVFHKPETAEEKKAHKKMLNDHFHAELHHYHKKVKAHRSRAKRKKSFWRWLLFFIKWEEKHILDINIKIVHGIVSAKRALDHFEEEEEEKIIQEAMKSLGGIMISFLSDYFREGKKSGFRIPDNLKEYWAITGK